MFSSIPLYFSKWEILSCEGPILSLARNLSLELATLKNINKKCWRTVCTVGEGKSKQLKKYVSIQTWGEVLQIDRYSLRVLICPHWSTDASTKVLRMLLESTWVIMFAYSFYHNISDVFVRITHRLWRILAMYIPPPPSNSEYSVKSTEWDRL